MSHAAATNERLGHAFHPNGRLQPRRHADLLQRVLQGQSVDHRGQHPHIVRGGRIDGRAHGGELPPAENVPAAADDRQLHAHPMHAGDLGRNGGHLGHADARLAPPAKTLAAQLEQHPFIGRLSWFRVGRHLDILRRQKGCSRQSSQDPCNLRAVYRRHPSKPRGMPLTRCGFWIRRRVRGEAMRSGKR